MINKASNLCQGMAGIEPMQSNSNFWTQLSPCQLSRGGCDFKFCVMLKRCHSSTGALELEIKGIKIMIQHWLNTVTCNHDIRGN